MIRLFTSTLIVALCFAGTLSAQTAATSDFYPLKDGASWTYIILNSEVEMKVSGTEMVGDQECYKVLTIVNGNEVGSELVAVKEDGVYRYQVSGVRPEKPILFLKFGEVGEKWEVDTRVAGQEVKGTFVLDEVKDLKIGDKTYPVALVVEGKKFTIAGQTSDVTYWFVKNVGIVKQQFSLDSQDTVMTLKPAAEEPAEEPAEKPMEDSDKDDDNGDNGDNGDNDASDDNSEN